MVRVMNSIIMSEHECSKSHPSIRQVRKSALLACDSSSAILSVADSVGLCQVLCRRADQAAYVLTDERTCIMVAWIISSAHNSLMLNLINDSCSLCLLLSCATGASWSCACVACALSAVHVDDVTQCKFWTYCTSECNLQFCFQWCAIEVC